MNNKEILKNVLVTVGLLTTSIVALVYFNSKLTDSTNQYAKNIAPSAQIHQYNPTSSNYAGSKSGSKTDMTATKGAVVPNTPAAVKSANYPNNLVIYASSNMNTQVVPGGSSSGTSIAPRSSMTQQRQQMQMGALTAVSSRRVSTSQTSNQLTATVSEPFQDGADVPGTISQKDFPVDPDEPFPDEDAPIGGGMVVLTLCALGYTLKQKLSKTH